MDDNGWFVTMVMYTAMFLSGLFKPVRPVAAVVKLYPKYSFNVLLVLVGAYCLLHSMHHHAQAPLYTWTGIVLLFAALWMTFFVVERPAEQRTSMVTESHDNWFHD